MFTAVFFWWVRQMSTLLSPVTARFAARVPDALLVTLDPARPDEAQIQRRRDASVTAAETLPLNGDPDIWRRAEHSPPARAMAIDGPKRAGGHPYAIAARYQDHADRRHGIAERCRAGQRRTREAADTAVGRPSFSQTGRTGAEKSRAVAKRTMDCRAWPVSSSGPASGARDVPIRPARSKRMTVGDTLGAFKIQKIQPDIVVLIGPEGARVLYTSHARPVAP